MSDERTDYGEGAGVASRILMEAFGPDVEEPRRLLEIRVQPEDLRALLARCLLFVPRGKNPPPALTNLSIQVSENWLLAAAADGFTLGVQKIACRADGPGSFLLSAWDASRILRILPRPAKERLEPATLTVVVGGSADDHRTLTLLHDSGATVSYTCLLGHVPFPNYWALVEDAACGEGDEPRQPIGQAAVSPAFVEKVTRAASVASDQAPYFVRWYTQRQPGRPVVASFAVEESHDEFLALLMPMYVKWEEHGIGDLGPRLRDLDSPSEVWEQAELL